MQSPTALFPLSADSLAVRIGLTKFEARFPDPLRSPVIKIIARSSMGCVILQRSGFVPLSR